MIFFRLILLSLACYRLTVLVTQDKGPAWIMLRFRKQVKRTTPKSISDGVDCPNCVSIWFGVGLALAEYYLTLNVWYEMSIYALALSGATILMGKIK